MILWVIYLVEKNWFYVMDGNEYINNKCLWRSGMLEIFKYLVILKNLYKKIK